MKKTVDCQVNQDRRRMTFAIERPVRGSGGNIYLSYGVVLALQGGFGAVLLASAMRMLVLLLAALIVSAGLTRGEIKTPENAPIEITSTGETTYENSLATARDNVAIHIGNTDIYADYAQYNSTTHDSSKPDFHLHARKIRIYEKDRVIMQYVTAYIGNVPVFWWPYLYQSLDNAFSFTIT